MTEPIPEHLPPAAPIEATVPPPNPIQAAEEEAAPPTENTYIEYGIQLPSGEVFFGNYLGRPIDTPETRAIMLIVLRKTAAELGFEEAEFLARYSWHGRQVHITDLGIVPITSEAAAPPLPQETLDAG